MASDDVTFRQRLHLFNVFWTIILYISASFSLYDTFVNRPQQLQGWQGVALSLLLIAFFVAYHRYFLRRSWRWPMPVRRATLYFSTQLTLLFLLTLLNPSFSGLSWAIFGQIFSVLRPRQWIWPTIPTLALVLVLFDLPGDVQRGDWLGLLGTVFTLAIFMGMFVTIFFAFRQRYILFEVVEELRAAKQALEQQAAQAEELAALRERTRLAREMHDNLGHALVVINIKLEAAQRLYDVDHTRGRQEIEATKTVVRDTMAALRRSLVGLRAPSHEHQDLGAALHRMADEFRASSQLAIMCRIADLPPVTSEVSEGLWRVAREALTNVQRHAQATHVRMTLERSADQIILRVADDGVGIRSQYVQQAGHYGITGMRERVDALGGTLCITQHSDGGTCVVASIPSGMPVVTSSAKERT